MVAVVGAGALLSFEVAADGRASGPPPDHAAAAAEAGADDPATSAGRSGGFGGTLVSALPVVRRDRAAVEAEQAAAQAAERAAAQRSAAASAERQRAEERAAEAEAAAARAAMWSRLADCESGRWDRDKQPIPGSARWTYGLDPSDDGFFQGGLQFHPVTWDEFRDPAMPDHAGAAPREVQIAVAERVLEVQGWEAWPVCSRKLGYR